MASRRRRSSSEDSADRWMTTYGDMVTLLLAFFVMLYAISQVDVAKFEAFIQGLAEPFANPAGQQAVLDGQPSIADAAPPAPLPDVDTPGAVWVSEGFPPAPPDSPPASTPGAKVADHAQLEEVRQRLVEALEEAGLETTVTFEVDERGLVVAIATDNVLFRSGSAEVSDTGRRILARIAPVLAGIDNQILVEGHTDDVPIAAADYDNWNLAADRAVAVLHLLLEEEHIAPGRLAATSYGQYHPRASNLTDEGRAQNRRVELVIVAGKEPS